MSKKWSAKELDDSISELPSTFSSSEDQSPWRRRFDSIYQALRARITTLEYAPGARLDIDALSSEFGVSRTPVRNVLQRLDPEGLVRTRHGVGTIVAPLDLDDIHQAIRLRIELASLIGKFSPDSVAAITAQKLHQVSLDVAQLHGAIDPVLFAETDMRVHEAICTMVANPLLRRIYDEMYFRTARLRTCVLPDQAWSHEVSALARDIELILDAMERNDFDGVAALVGNSVHETFARVEGAVRAGALERSRLIAASS